MLHDQKIPLCFFSIYRVLTKSRIKKLLSYSLKENVTTGFGLSSLLHLEFEQQLPLQMGDPIEQKEEIEPEFRRWSSKLNGQNE